MHYSIRYISDQNRALLTPKRAILGHQCQKTARRAAERAPTGTPKVSRVTSGHGVDMIPLSWVRLRRNNWVIWAKIHLYFGTPSHFFFSITFRTNHQKGNLLCASTAAIRTLGWLLGHFWLKRGRLLASGLEFVFFLAIPS